MLFDVGTAGATEKFRSGAVKSRASVGENVLLKPLLIEAAAAALDAPAFCLALFIIQVFKSEIDFYLNYELKYT